MTWLWKLPFSLIFKVATAHSIDPAMLAAIVSVESAGNYSAIKYEKDYRHLSKVDFHAKENNITPDTEKMLQKTSHGLTQIMGATARWLGFTGNLLDLYNPELNLNYGAIYFSKLCHKYPKIEDAISAYNAGSPIITIIDGKYINDVYVDEVIRRKDIIKQLLIRKLE